MQLDTAVFLPIAEAAGEVAMVDMEASGTKGDYNSLLVVTVKPWHRPPITLSCVRPGDDRKLVKNARDLLHEYAMWVTYYGKGFDIPMLQSRLIRHNFKPLSKHLHLDLYWHARASLLTARRSQAHLLEWLECPRKKMTLSPELWNLVQYNPRNGLKILRARCESDCAGLEALYDRIKHLVVNVTR